MNETELREYLIANLNFSIFVNSYQKRIEFKLTLDNDSFNGDKTTISEDWINFDDLRID